MGDWVLSVRISNKCLHFHSFGHPCGCFYTVFPYSILLAAMPAAPPIARAALLDHPLLREGRLWQAGSLGRCQSRVLGSGFEALDAELPGGGWPCQALCEILQPAGQHAEWRLLAPGLRGLFASSAG
ncbi:MAG TPA: hypothetical protein VK195_04950, partial [Burkholderiaceae bacterium]|nr:hypothetical protein [Burkholderiaceae bacterium]